MVATLTLPNGQTKEVTLTQFVEHKGAPLQDQIWHQAYASKGEKITLQSPQKYEQIVENIAVGASSQIIKETNFHSMSDAIREQLLKDKSLKEKLQPILDDVARNYTMHQKKEAHQHGFSDVEHLSILRKNALDHQMRLEKAIRSHNITIDLSHEQGVPPPQTHGSAHIDKAHTSGRAVG